MPPTPPRFPVLLGVILPSELAINVFGLAAIPVRMGVIAFFGRPCRAWQGRRPLQAFANACLLMALVRLSIWLTSAHRQGREH
jgi:hypothetical protein